MISPDSERWWPEARPTRLFAIPPFPGSTIGPLVVKHDAALPTTVEVEACIAAMRRLRVGGTFWAAQPTASDEPRILARPRDMAQYRQMAVAAETCGQRVTFWLPGPRAARASGAAHPIVGPVDPWHLLGGASALWTAPDDDVAMIAAIAGTAVRAFGAQSCDAVSHLTALITGIRFHDPFSGAIVSPSAFVEMLGFWRALIDANRPIDGVYGVAFWKRQSIAPLLWDGGDDVRFLTAYDPDGSAAAAWIARTPPAILAALERNGTPVHQVEDGFIRSVGLGADCVPPLSIVVDPAGAHYDIAQASGLETMLEQGDFTPDMLARARRLRALIVARGISKYALGTGQAARRGGDRRHVLVTGQVEDDQSVLKGGGGVTNLDLLHRVRACEPDAFIVYRPHPDVDAGHRMGYIADDVVLTIADSIARDVAITALIDAADHVHVLTSLAGFEALMRGKPVTAHGVPFYAGWGLTEDLGPVPPRRTARRTLDELVAATLLLYPRYLDPVTGLPCPPEVLIDRIAAGHRRQNTPLVAARRLVGHVAALARRVRGAALNVQQPIHALAPAGPDGDVLPGSGRTFLLLQGPPGPFFWELAQRLRRDGAVVHRINLSGGDDYDWPGDATDYRGRMADWTLYVDRYMRARRVTDLVLFGDCRPVHIAARQMAQLRHIRVHVFEEGYVRPNWMTLEPGGVNGNSTFGRDPRHLIERARGLPPVPDLPPIIANSKRRARDSYWHYHYVCVGRLLRRYPHYWSHRPGSILAEGIAWAKKLWMRRQVARDAERTLAGVVPGSYFLFPLQLGTDYQIRAHSPFSTMHQAVDYVMASFAEHAPKDAVLLIKEHPLDISLRSWRAFIAAHARRFHVADRVVHVAGGDLHDLARDARGMVVVNSTSATFALAEGRPVITLGSAIYSIPGITHQGPLDTFWSAPVPPRPEVYDAFLRCLHDHCLVRGGLASQSATRILVASASARLLPADAA